MERHLIRPLLWGRRQRQRTGALKEILSSQQAPGNLTLLLAPLVTQISTVYTCKMAMTLQQARIVRYRQYTCPACASQHKLSYSHIFSMCIYSESCYCNLFHWAVIIQLKARNATAINDSLQTAEEIRYI